MFHRRYSALLMVVPVFVIAAACDRQTGPLPLAKTSETLPQMALAASNAQTFDVTMRSAREGETPMIRVLHVARHRTGKGWRTSIRIDPTEVPKGQASVRNEITGIEIDEDGKRMISIQGRALIPASRGKVSVGKGPQGFSITTKEPTLRSAADPFDMLEKVVFAKSESSSRLARVTEKLGSSPAARNGRLVYRQNATQGTAEFEYDANSGLPLRAKGPAPRGSTLIVEHTYREAGGLLVMTSTTNTLTGGANPRVMTLSLSHITVDGKEIVQ